MQQGRWRINGTAVRTGSAGERILMHTFMSKVPDFSAAVEKEFHANAPARDILLLLHRRERKPAPQLLLPLLFAPDHSHGESLQCTIDHYLAVRRLEHNGKLLYLTDV